MAKRVICLVLGALFLLALPLRANAAVVKKGVGTEKKIALTFDDGPSRENTDKILSILEKYKVKATFFVIGENAEKDPERIRKIYDAGHEIGNHTYSHAYISKIAPAALQEEILKTEEILKGICGKRPVVFRPPGGYYDDASIALVEELGYRSILWSLDTRDWSMPHSDRVASQVESDTCEGDIILFHDLEDKRLPTPKALERILPYLIRNGYEFVTVSELLENEAD
ncbi:MAG: polysaccharide deacetylase family protein [Clostridia bacterium]|nr:polysaccharide deacetylase family protein [Clostridia bacterium]